MYPAPPVTRTVLGGEGDNDARATIDDAHDDNRKTKNRGLVVAGKVQCRRKYIVAASRRLVVKTSNKGGLRCQHDVTTAAPQVRTYSILYDCVQGPEVRTVQHPENRRGGTIHMLDELAVLVKQRCYYTAAEERFGRWNAYNQPWDLRQK